MTKKEEQEGIKVKKSENFSDWYNEVVIKAELADYSSVSGFMVIRPRAYAIWEVLQQHFDKRIKIMGVKNAYFPLLIPEDFFKKEAEHAEGFAPELAWVKQNDEKLAIRPTSETIMYDSYSRWIRSWRDLPLRINQWCSVLRWEVKQAKLFLRTREFLWHEGHCVYATKEECDKETRMILDEYQYVCEELLAIPVVPGIKTDNEKFAGAFYTLTVEALMPDGKALQMGTSHNLGKGFAKVFNIKFLGKDEKEHIPWQNSWAFSTRLIGAIIMVHGDDNGLVLPPRIAPEKVVIVPILFKGTKEKVIQKAKEVQKTLKKYKPILDEREEYSAGWKYNEWEMKGVPLRIEIGPKDVEKGQAVIVRRDTSKKEFVKITDIDLAVKNTLENMHKEMYEKAKTFLDQNIAEALELSKLKDMMKERKLAKTYFCGGKACEEDLRQKIDGATSRVIPFDSKEKGKCVNCEKEGKLTYFAKSY